MFECRGAVGEIFPKYLSLAIFKKCYIIIRDEDTRDGASLQGT